MAERAPTGLQAAGKALWRVVQTGYTLREDERQALVGACRTLDELGRLEKALKTAPVVVLGSTGQERPNPLFAEVRAHRLALKGLLLAVGLTDAEADRHAGAARSSAGRKLARQRWDQRGAA